MRWRKSADSFGQDQSGIDELLSQMTKAVLGRALETEISDHLGYESGDFAGIGTGNSRNGKSTKTVETLQGPLEIMVPRNRDASFEPTIVPKRSKRARQSRRRDLVAVCQRYDHSGYQRSYARNLWHSGYATTISTVTDVITDEITFWQNRPLEVGYPIVYIDAVWLKIRDGGAVKNKACYLAVGGDLKGRKQVLGMWIAQNGGAKFWFNVLAQLKNRGINDILILCCDGLNGLPEAVNAIYPDTDVQTCVVRLLGAAMKYASYQDRKAMAKAMRPIYHRSHRARRGSGL